MATASLWRVSANCDLRDPVGWLAYSENVFRVSTTHTRDEDTMGNYQYTNRGGRTYVLCTRCTESLVPAPTTFEEDPICQGCTPQHDESAWWPEFLRIAVPLGVVEAVVVATVLGLDGIAHMWHVITPW